MAKSKLEQFIKQPRRSLIYLSIPAIASAMVETFYNLTDTFFIGRLGAEALAAMTFSFPLFFMLVSLSLGINAGMGSRISRYIGEGNKRQAENTAIHGLALSLVISLLIALIAIPLLPFLFKVLGAQGIVLSYAISYTAIILAGSLFMFLSYALSSFFAAQGDTKTAMKIDVYSLIANMILTPIFMFVFDMGIAGAALATVLSVIYAFVLALYYLRDSYLTLSLKKFKYSSSIIKEIFEVGFPSTLMMLTISFYVVFLNRAMAHFSVEHVAAFGVVSRLETVVTLPVFGLSIGAMTLAGMFFGAKKYKLLKDVSKFSLWLGVGTSIIIGFFFFLFARVFLRFFTSDASVIAVGVPYMMLDALTFPTMAVAMIASRVMQAMGYGLPGFVINAVRVFVVAIPLAYFFVFVMGYGYLSIAIAMIMGGIASNIVSLVWLKRVFKKQSIA